MNLFPNCLFKRVGDSGPVERLLWVSANGAVCYCIATDGKRAWPVPADYGALKAAVSAGKVVVLDNDELAASLRLENMLTEHQKELMASSYLAIKDLVEDPARSIFDRQQSGKLIRQAAQKANVSLTTIYKQLRRYWQRGQTSWALQPDLHRCGGAGKPHAAGTVKLGRPTLDGKQLGVNATAEIQNVFRDGIEKFVVETRTLTRLRHVREIVEVFDHFEANGTAYMVMELLVGRTLQRFLLEEGGSIDYRRALGLILPIAKAVHAVHGLGLVHRDISPDNIFLVDRAEAKLLDFGAARHYIGEAIGALQVILKRGYAPPEQYHTNGEQGPWTDVYALSATLYCALTGRPPPDASTRQDDEPLIRPSRQGIVLPAPLEEVLITGLAMRWQDRPQDMKTWLSGLNRALL